MEETTMAAIPPMEITTDHISDVARESVVMKRGISAIWPGAKIDGAPVFTVQVPSGDNSTLFNAIDRAPEGSAIVVNGNGYLGRSLWGAIMSFAAMQRGIVGLVVDGLVRDREDLERLGFPVFALGVTPIAPRPRKLGNMDVPIMCGGIRVAPGDALFADADGVVVIEAARKDEVLKRAWERAESEDAMFKELQSGSTMGEIIAKTGYSAPTASY